MSIIREHVEVPYGMGWQKMPHGQYQGKHFSEAPVKYLAWWVSVPHPKKYDRLVSEINDYLEKEAPKEAAQLTGFTFGKHQGKPWSEVPKGYIEFMLTKVSDPILRMAMEKELERREEDPLKIDLDIEQKKQERIDRIKHREKVSDWIGDIGEEITRKVIFDNTFESESNYGTTYINLFHDEEDNIIVYSGGSNFKQHLTSLPSYKEGKPFTITFKPREFFIRKSVRQTKISNPKIDYNSL